MPFGFRLSPSSLHPTEIHPVDTPHPSESKAGSSGGDRPSAPVVTPGHNPFPPASSGLPSSSAPIKSPLKNITLPNESARYAIRTIPDEQGRFPLLRRDPDTDAPLHTGKYVKPDGHGGWELEASGAQEGERSAITSTGRGGIDDQMPGPSRRRPDPFPSDPEPSKKGLTRQQQAALNYKDRQGNHPFVRDDGSVDVTGYRRHTQEGIARHYTDAQGNHPFVGPDSTIAVRDYERFMQQDLAGDRPLTAEQQEAIEAFDDALWPSTPEQPTAAEMLEEFEFWQSARDP